MRKYWKLITLVTVIILTIGSIYIQSAVKVMNYPKYVIEHVSGDEAEVKPVTIQANYTMRTDYIYPSITDKGTSYHDPSSYVSTLGGYWLSDEIKYLQKKYRSFVRGKDPEVNKYYKDDQIVAYVTVDYDYSYKLDHDRRYSFNIDVLDQKTNKVKAFAIPIVMDGELDYIDVQAIRFLDGELKIFTVHDLVRDVGRAGENEIHLYSIDMETGKLVGDDVIDPEMNITKNNKFRTIFSLNHGYDLGTSNYIVYRVEESEVIEDDDLGSENEILESQLFAYNLETGTQEKVKLPEKYTDAYPMILEEATLLLAHETTNQLEVIGFNLDTQEVETEQHFPMINSEEEFWSRYVFANDKIYLVNQLEVGKIGAEILIADPKTGDILYEGIVKRVPSKQNKQENRGYIHTISVTKE